MYNRTIRSFILLLFMLFFMGLICFSTVAFADSYSSGVAAYKRGAYETAAQAFVTAYQQDPKDPKKLFYLGLALAQAGHYSEARDCFDRVGQMLPSTDPLAVKARNNMAVITQAHLAANGNSQKAKQVITSAKKQDNYLAYAIPDGKVIHWDPAKMPLKVYISDGSNIPGWQPEMKSMVTKAMSLWQTATRNKVRFITASQEKKADIVVRWKRNFDHNKVGDNPFESWGNTIVRSDVNIALYTGSTGQRLPLEEVENTAIHELGHAIGIQGHSPYPEDIMYYSSSPMNGNALTSRDVTTINLLYKMDADIKNSANLTTAQTRNYYGMMEQAIKSQKSRNPQQAIAQYQKALQLNPTDPDLYYNLGGALWDTGDTANAMLSYRKALSLDGKRADAKYNLGALLVNDGVRQINGNNRGQAKQNFQEAVVLFQEVLLSPNPPPNTRKNLDIAQKNLTLMSQ